MNETLRSAMKLGLAALVAIGITQWSGRTNTLMMALMGAVMFVNENETAPLQRILQFVGGAVLGAACGLLVGGLHRGWLALAVALLATGALVRVLRLEGGQSQAYLTCWASLELVHGNRFEVGVLFNLVLPFLIGTLAAQAANWLVWPKLRRRRLAALDQSIAGRFQQQLAALRRWLGAGDGPPPPLHSSEVLPAIQQLQQLAGTRALSVPPAQQRRWRQLGLLWRQVLREWLLLEPQLRALPAPLPAALPPQLHSALAQLDQGLATEAAHPVPAPGLAARQPEPWQAWGEAAGAPALVPLALGQQLAQLGQLLRSQALVRRGL